MTLFQVVPLATQPVQSEQLIAEQAVALALGTQSDPVATSDTGAFSLLGLLKRISQALTLIVANTGTNAARQSSTGTVTTPSVTTTSSIVLAASALTKRWMIYNPGTTTIYLEYGATATVANSLPIPGGFLWIDPTEYNGSVSAVVAIGSQVIQVRRLT